MPATVLVHGDRLVMRGGAVASLTQVDTSEALAWQTGILQFRDVKLGKAIAELNRYSETKLRPAVQRAPIRTLWAGGRHMPGRMHSHRSMRPA